MYISRVSNVQCEGCDVEDFGRHALAQCYTGNIFHLVRIFTCHCRVILMGSDHFLSGKQIGNLNPF